MKHLQVTKKDKPILEMDITDDQSLMLADAMRWGKMFRRRRKR